MKIDLKKLASLLIRYNKQVLVILFTLLIISSFGLKNFKLDASSDALVIEGDQSFQQYRETEEEFGDSSFLIVTFEPKRELFSDYSLDRLKNLEKDLKDIDGVESILSILDAPIFFQPKVSLTEVSDNLKDLRSGNVDLIKAKEEIVNNPIYRELIISKDAKVTAMQVVLKGNDEYNSLIDKRYEITNQLKTKEPLTSDQIIKLQKDLIITNKRISEINDYESEFTKNLILEIRSILNKYKDDAQIFLGGPSMIAVDMMSFIEADLIVFGLAVSLIFAVMLYMFFGSLIYLFLPLVNAMLTTVITAGFLGFMDWKISVVSSNFIALLLILTISLTVHLIVKINEYLKTMNLKDSIVNAYDQMFIPCFFAAFTTAIAFLSLTFGEIKPVIEFGKMMAFGICIAFFLTFTFLPCAIYLFNKIRTNDFFSLHKVTISILNFSKTNSIILSICFMLSFISFLYGISRLEVENRFIDYFDERTEIHQGMLEIDTRLGGTSTLDIIISKPKDEFESIFIDDDFFEEDLFDDDSSSASGYWWNTYSLKKLENIHDHLDSMPEIGKVLSVASGLKLARKINDDKDLNDLELALLRSVLPEDIRDSLLYAYINKDDSVVRISTRVNESSSKLNRKDLLIKIENDLQNKFNLERDQFEITGLAVLYNNMLQSLFNSQINSLFIVFIVISLMLLLIFKSFKIMIIGLIPNLFIASSVMGLLGILNIPLDLMTITVAAISVGMAVDNTIHYIYRYKKELKINHETNIALFNAHTTTGRAIFYTATTISAGFMILCFSNFYPTVLFGIFTAIAMMLAFISSLTILPILLVKSKAFE